MKASTSLKISQRIFVAILFVFLSAKLVSAQPDGKNLFETNCKQCHDIGKGIVIGPDLKDVDKRRPDKAWLHKWIRNSQTVVKSGDPYAVALFNKFNHTVMTPFNFKDEEIDAILTYIKDYKPTTPPPPPDGGGGGPATKSNLVLYLL